MPRRAEVRRIDLHDKARLGDGLVFLLQRIGQRLDISVLVLIVAIGHEFGQHAGRRGVHKGFCWLGGGAGRGEVFQIGFERAPVAVGHRSGAARHGLPAEPRGAAARLVEPLQVIGVVEQVAMRRGLGRLVIVAAAECANPGEAVAHVEGVGNFAELAVADNVDAGRSLIFDDVVDRGRETIVEGPLVELPAGLPRFEKCQQIGRPRQAPDMGRQNAVGTELHEVSDGVGSDGR